jgi:hypothetical protein
MESISYIACTNNLDILSRFLMPTLKLEQDDELIIVDNASSIAIGYNQGIEKAKHKIKCFIHHDILVTNSSLLRNSLINYCDSKTGIVGVIGAKTDAAPWWESPELIGSTIDGRRGLTYFTEGGEDCLFLDGMLLATSQDIQFDENIPGFHLYDQDICKQMADKGYTNYCLKDGYTIMSHFTSAPFDLSQIKGYHEALVVYRKKWA